MEERKGRRKRDRGGGGRKLILYSGHEWGESGKTRNERKSVRERSIREMADSISTTGVTFASFTEQLLLFKKG